MRKLLHVINKFFACGLFLIIIGCSDYPNNTIGIYTLDKKYACECPDYNIIEFIYPIDYNKKNTIDAIMLNKGDYISSEPKDREYNNLINKEINPIFSNSYEEKQFSNDDFNKAWGCYYYYFEGNFINNEDFLVKKYQAIPISKECIRESEKSWEKMRIEVEKNVE